MTFFIITMLQNEEILSVVYLSAQYRLKRCLHPRVPEMIWRCRSVTRCNVVTWIQHHTFNLISSPNLHFSPIFPTIFQRVLYAISCPYVGTFVSRYFYTGTFCKKKYRNIPGSYFLWKYHNRILLTGSIIHLLSANYYSTIIFIILDM